MSLLREKIDILEPFFLIIATLVVCLLMIGLRFSETRYSVERFYLSISQGSEVSESFKVDKLNERRDESIEEIKVKRPPGKFEADLATFAVWAAIGLGFFTIGRILYKSFVYPFYHDNEEYHYVNANKKYLIKKRLIWIASIVVTSLLLAFTIAIFKTVILPYYTIVTFAPKLDVIMVLVGGIAITVFMISMLKIGIRTIFRAY
jgi:hypothetical protein